MILHIKDASKRSKLRFPGGKNYPADARLVDCPEAHQAGLQRNVDFRRVQTEVTDVLRRFAHGHELGMGCHRSIHPCAVETTADQLSPVYKHCTDRHLAIGQRKPGLLQRQSHPVQIKALLNI